MNSTAVISDGTISDEIIIEPTALQLKNALDEMLLVVACGFILMMQAGFALLESGIVRKKNS